MGPAPPVSRVRATKSVLGSRPIFVACHVVIVGAPGADTVYMFTCLHCIERHRVGRWGAKGRIKRSEAPPINYAKKHAQNKMNSSSGTHRTKPTADAVYTSCRHRTWTRGRSTIIGRRNTYKVVRLEEVRVGQGRHGDEPVEIAQPQRGARERGLKRVLHQLGRCLLAALAHAGDARPDDARRVGEPTHLCLWICTALLRNS